MERGTGPTALIEIVDEVHKPETRWAARKRLEREHAAEIEFHAAQYRRARNEERMRLELYRRRFEFPAGARTGGARQKITCPHMRVVWFQVEHPRYGEDVPVFESTLRRLKAGRHKCVAGAQQ